MKQQHDLQMTDMKTYFDTYVHNLKLQHEHQLKELKNQINSNFHSNSGSSTIGNNNNNNNNSNGNQLQDMKQYYELMIQQVTIRSVSLCPLLSPLLSRCFFIPLLPLARSHSG